MNTNLLRLLACTGLCVSVVAGPAFGQTDHGSLPEKKAEEPNGLPLDEAAIQSRIPLYSDTTKGQRHAEDSQQFQAVAERFIAALSARDAKEVNTQYTIPFFLEDERIVSEEAVKARLSEIIFPGVFAKAESKKMLLLDTLQQMEQLLEQQIPAKAREQWRVHLERSSRIAIVSGGPMLVGLSLRKTDEKYTVSGLLFAYFPKQDAKILKAVNEDLLDHQ
ncbi:MAG: hypothetical protein R3C12_04095 [Planctomycetaceae bacterium]